MQLNGAVSVCFSNHLVFLSSSVMEVNKDEAERCIEIALGALENAQPEKARRFLEKAQRLYATPRAQGERLNPG